MGHVQRLVDLSNTIDLALLATDAHFGSFNDGEPTDVDLPTS